MYTQKQRESVVRAIVKYNEKHNNKGGLSHVSAQRKISVPTLYNWMKSASSNFKKKVRPNLVAKPQQKRRGRAPISPELKDLRLKIIKLQKVVAKAADILVH